VTGYFLGKGIYFADMCSKSAEYCHATPESNYGLLLLCEVALGRWFQTAHGKYVSKEDLTDAGFHSTKGCGELAPDPSFDFTSSDGYVIPLGREMETGVLYSELPHNEFVVYDPAQVLVRYAVKLTFTFVEKRAQIAY
jgi:poly [ADP-ribose] polymerase